MTLFVFTFFARMESERLREDDKVDKVMTSQCDKEKKSGLMWFLECLVACWIFFVLFMLSWLVSCDVECLDYGFWVVWDGCLSDVGGVVF